MELIINISIVDRKDCIPSGTAEYSTIQNTKYLDFFYQTLDFGFSNTKPMDSDLTELLQCFTPTMVKIIHLPVTTTNISINF